MPELSAIFASIAAMFAGGAAASGWTSAVIVANSSFDGLDAGRADRHLRRVLSASATFQAGLLGIAAGFAVFSGAIGAFIVALVGALGFLSNLWTLSPRRDKTVPGVRRREKTQRTVAVVLTLMVTAVAAAAGIMATLGI
jgi:ABC-type xylose transport system permease subunit